MKAEVDDDEEVYHDYDSSTETVNYGVPVTSIFESNEKVINDVKPCEKVFGWMHKNNIGISSISRSCQESIIFFHFIL